MQCGVACLAMIAAHHGKRYSLPFLTEYCTPTAEGVSMLGIADGARAIGLEGKAYKLPVAIFAEKDFPFPAILHWNQNHFVVIYKVDKKLNHFYIADPGKGLLCLSRNEFENKWISCNDSSGTQSGIAMLLKPTERFGTIDDPTVGQSRSFYTLFRYLHKYRRYFFQMALGLLFACILQLAMPFLTQSIVDIGIAKRDIGFVWLILLGELMIIIGRTVTDFIRRWLLLHVSMRINIEIISDFLKKLLKLPMSFFEAKLTGDILQRMGDHGRIQSFLTSEFLDILFVITSILVFGAVLFIYNTAIFGIFIIFSGIYALWMTIFLRKRKIIDYEYFEQQSLNQNLIYRFINTMQEIKLQNCEKRRCYEWEDIQADLFKVQMKSLHLQQTQEAGSIFINEIKNILITVMAATAVINGQMTLGSMLAIQYIIGQLNSPISQLMKFIYSIQDVNISLERINHIHQSRGEAEKPNNETTPIEANSGILLNNVHFRYDRHSRHDIICGISAKIEPGKITAIVGASGSGKSTLVKLMLGYYSPNQGEVIVNGRSLFDYDLKWWRKHCGAVMQDGIIFSDTIARNIAVSDGPVDMEKVRSAAALANIDQYVMSLPLQYNTRIGPDGIGLSKGQLQRILIARVIYRNPDFIFLDEATNSLDASNECQITHRINEFFKGHTMIIVAHRLSTVCNADQILVMDKGRIAESGSHEELIKLRGIYYSLIKNQLELGI